MWGARRMIQRERGRKFIQKIMAENFPNLEKETFHSKNPRKFQKKKKMNTKNLHQDAL